MSTDDLKERLSAVLEEIKYIMAQRKDQVEKLRDQIVVMENQNEDLERKVHEIMNDF